MATAPLKPLAPEAVRQLYQDWREKVHQTVAAGIGARPLDPATRKALDLYAIKVASTRNPLKSAEIEKLAALTAPEVMAHTQATLQKAPLSQAKKFMAYAEDPKAHRQRYDEIFQGQDRLYFPLLSPARPSVTEEAVTQQLADQGYSVVDYAAGIATDAKGKNNYRIGKLLKGTALADLFSDDPSRNEGRQLVVLSRHPLDIARMSTNRAWISCMAEHRNEHRYVRQDINKGTLIAYLVSANDPNITDPHARVLLKPLIDPAQPDQVAMLVDKPQGLTTPLFEDTVHQLATQHFNHDKQGTFRLAPGLYKERASTLTFNRPQTTAEVWQSLEALSHPGEALHLDGDFLREVPSELRKDIFTHIGTELGSKDVVLADYPDAQLDLPHAEQLTMHKGRAQRVTTGAKHIKLEATPCLLQLHAPQAEVINIQTADSLLGLDTPARHVTAMGCRKLETVTAPHAEKLSVAGSGVRQLTTSATDIKANNCAQLEVLDAPQVQTLDVSRSGLTELNTPAHTVNAYSCPNLHTAHLPHAHTADLSASAQLESVTAPTARSICLSHCLALRQLDAPQVEDLEIKDCAIPDLATPALRIQVDMSPDLRSLTALKAQEIAIYMCEPERVVIPEDCILRKTSIRSEAELNIVRLSPREVALYEHALQQGDTAAQEHICQQALRRTAPEQPAQPSHQHALER